MKINELVSLDIVDAKVYNDTDELVIDKCFEITVDVCNAFEVSEDGVLRLRLKKDTAKLLANQIRKLLK